MTDTAPSTSPQLTPPSPVPPGTLVCPECKRYSHKEVKFANAKELGKHRRFKHGIAGAKRAVIVKAALYRHLREASEAMYYKGITHNGIRYGIGIPDLIEVCEQIAREDHEDIHQAISFFLRYPEIAGDYFDEDGPKDKGRCHFCGEMILATRPIQRLHGITRENIDRGDEEPRAAQEPRPQEPPL